MAKRLVLIRHGETEWSRDGRHTGRTDVPLTKEGEKRARFLSQRLRRLGVEPLRVLSSPRQRAIETARLAAFEMPEITHLLAEVDYGEYEGRTSGEIRAERPGWDLFTDGTPGDDLHEWDYGEYEGLTTPQIHETRPEWNLWRDGCPGGESPPEVGARADRVLARLASAEGDAVAFAHGHILRVLGATYLGLPPDQARCLALDAAGVSILGHEHWWRAVRVWNSSI